MYARISVQTGDFSLDAVINELKQETKAVGGICSFTGCVRDINGGEDVSSLFLEHYPEMTEKQLAKILDTAEARFDLLGAIVIHRIGLLHPGENIVLVAAASAHRAAAFDACHFVMDYLKTQATFWKQEQRHDGGKSWLAMRESDEQATADWEAKKD
jgi:molybdopterin synthase catalytic subunit